MKRVVSIMSYFAQVEAQKKNAVTQITYAYYVPYTVWKFNCPD